MALKNKMRISPVIFKDRNKKFPAGFGAQGPMTSSKKRKLTHYVITHKTNQIQIFPIF